MTDPVDYIFKHLSLDHLEALLLLDQRCYGGHWGAQGYRDELERDNSVVLGCFDSGSVTLLGFGILWRVLTEAHIISLAVDPAHQRRGVGMRILQHLLREARQQECEWATLEVREHNQAAIQLYEKAGFQQLGQRKQYYSDTGESALIYWKKPV